MDGDFLRRQYDSELDRQDRIVSSLSLPFGALTALGGLIGIMMRGFSYQHYLLTRLFLTLIVFALTAYGWTIYFLVRCYFGQTYEYLPRLRELRDYQDA